MTVLAYIAAALLGSWGVAHAIPTRRVVEGFGSITKDNSRILVSSCRPSPFRRE